MMHGGSSQGTLGMKAPGTKTANQLLRMISSDRVLVIAAGVSRGLAVGRTGGRLSSGLGWAARARRPAASSKVREQQGRVLLQRQEAQPQEPHGLQAWLALRKAYSLGKLRGCWPCCSLPMMLECCPSC